MAKTSMERSRTAALKLARDVSVDGLTRLRALRLAAVSARTQGSVVASILESDQTPAAIRQCAAWIERLQAQAAAREEHAKKVGAVVAASKARVEAREAAERLRNSDIVAGAASQNAAAPVERAPDPRPPRP